MAQNKGKRESWSKEHLQGVFLVPAQPNTNIICLYSQVLSQPLIFPPFLLYHLIPSQIFIIIIKETLIWFIWLWWNLKIQIKHYDIKSVSIEHVIRLIKNAQQNLSD